MSGKDDSKKVKSEQRIDAGELYDTLTKLVKNYGGEDWIEKIKVYVEKMEALKNGTGVSWTSTQYPKQALRLILRADVPSRLSVKELFEEMKKAELRLNQDSEIKYKIEFGD
jgi:hypothetical protein